MRIVAHLLLAGALLASLAAPAVAQDAEGAPRIVVVQAPPRPAIGFDNLRFGLGQFANGGIPDLFGGGAAISMGLDYGLGSGLAVGWDTFNLYKDYGAATYFLSINPLQMRYRLALDVWDTPLFSPFVTVGGGLSLMSLLGGPSGRPQLGIGPAGSIGLGAVIGQGLNVEVGYNAGQVSAIGYQGWQFRLGTSFGQVGSFQGLVAGAQAIVQDRQPATSEPLAGRVESVSGDRLVLAVLRGRLAPGEDVLVYYEDGMVVKVARARLEASSGQGRAIARVLAATEPIKPGYRIRAW